MKETWQFFSSFGPIAYLLIISSIVILTLSIERLITLYLQPKLPVKALAELSKSIKMGKNQQAMEIKNSLNKHFHEWVEILFTSPRTLAEDELSLLINQKRISLQRPLDWLNLFAIVSPMLGLLGTIWSMSHSFSELSKNLTGDNTHKMITYLSEAMYATAFGIILALLSMFCLYFLKQKSERYLDQCEFSLNKVSLALSAQSLQGN